MPLKFAAAGLPDGVQVFDPVTHQPNGGKIQGGQNQGCRAAEAVLEQQEHLRPERRHNR